MELFANAVRPATSLRARLRRGARNSYLTLRGLAPPRPGTRFLRCLNLHYVFDDQRAAFERHIDALRDIGEFVDTDSMVSMISGATPADGRYFHLSFDDGLRCVLRNAAPILDARGIPAIVFINSAMSGEPDAPTRQAWRAATGYACPLAAMSWEDLRAIRAARFAVGAHTRHHVRLSAISSAPDRLDQEVTGCKRDIEEKLGAECRYFAWPYGTLADIDAASVRKIREAGFLAAFGVNRMAIAPGRTNPYMIPRHHFEPQWPRSHVRFFACGGLERAARPSDW